ncbi:MULTISPECIES: serpin family protein [Kitasatospora]|uniref:Serpin domain-containing protein n=1 Tax=Kitasatospora setae (strain ATCC 33774 / DSM 43861 / JCM 3304 / KCC A-0304 / NBRC 14216 / KM-6054) TaxID=452652 RepID=E4N860_KITSK|nr:MULTISPECIES: serpin family protein [Kitasatospora]BAJ27391.1 hypothetical protein KSE_15640 [Kitasatospora setae KM-6054]
MATDAIERVNALGARWGRELDHTVNQAWTALGVWPLLAALAAGAAGPARTELAQALGAPADQAPAQARELLELIRRVPGCAAALGVWTAADAGVEDGWRESLDASLWGQLTGDAAKDRAALDAWARERTGGLVPGLSIEPSGALLVLASALTVRTRWARRFHRCRHQPQQGPWAGLEPLMLEASGPGLFERLALAETSAGPVTEVRVAGGGEVDVHLVLGEPGAEPAAVVGAGFELVAGAAERRRLTDLPDGAPGPGLRLRSVESSEPEHQALLVTAGFEVRVEHDLLAHAGAFGLRAATGDGSHFPGISRTVPLKVGRAGQAATAEFSAAGFEAGAVTELEVPRGASGSSARFPVRWARAAFDRPFAFLAVHRPTGLVLIAGWVAEPGVDADADA